MAAPRVRLEVGVESDDLTRQPRSRTTSALHSQSPTETVHGLKGEEDG
jgi:hypothetical protein